jgi:hypothetical protein
MMVQKKRKLHAVATLRTGSAALPNTSFGWGRIGSLFWALQLI